MGQVRKIPRRRVLVWPLLVPCVAAGASLLLWPLVRGGEEDDRQAAGAPGSADLLTGARSFASLPTPGERSQGEAQQSPADAELDPDSLEAEEPIDPADAGDSDVEADADATHGETREAVAWVTRGNEPAGGLRVRAWQRGLEGGRPLAVTTTRPNGAVVFSPRPEGPLTLVIDDGARQVVSRDNEGIELEGIETFAGTVTDLRGQGLAADLVLWVGAVPLARARADLSGAFRLQWVPTPDAVLEASAEGFLPVRVATGQAERITLRPGDSGWLTGRVVDGAGLPVEGALVQLLRGERSPVLAASDVSGRFVFPRLEAGAVTLEAHLPAESMPAVRTDARIPAGEVAEVEIALTSAAALRVRLTSPEGPLAGWGVRVVDPGVTRYGGYSESLAQPSTRSDEEGLARFEGLPPGRYYVRAESPQDKTSLLAEVELRAGAESEVTLAPSERRLTVKVIDPQGLPVSGIYMDVSMPGINWHGMPSTTTRADGLGRFEHLPVGLAEVHLGQGNLWRMVRCEGEEATFVWTQAGQLRLDGRVHGYEGEALVVCVLPDVAHLTRAVVQNGGLVQVEVTPPAGACQVFLLARDRRLAPLDLGRAGESSAPLLFDATFLPGATLRGRLVDAAQGQGIPGRVRLPGALAAALEAQAQWLGGTDEDEWITINEWSRATGPDGSFELTSLPPGPLALDLQALGAAPRQAPIDPLVQGETRDLRDLPLQPR